VKHEAVLHHLSEIFKEKFGSDGIRTSIKPKWPDIFVPSLLTVTSVYELSSLALNDELCLSFATRTQLSDCGKL